ncbi:MAG: ASCH domain-containing protein [Breznakibacter sp.]
MKTITIKQPWASLICAGIKDIENRTWPTKYRGRVLVHAAASWFNFNKQLPDGFEYPIEVQDAILNGMDDPDYYPTGAIIGSVEIVDCVINHPSIWAEKSKQAQFGKLVIQQEKPTYHWVLANPVRFPEPIPTKGRLGIWNYPGILTEGEEENRPYS